MKTNLMQLLRLVLMVLAVAGGGLGARGRKGLVKDEGRVGISDDLCHWKPRSGI